MSAPQSAVRQIVRALVLAVVGAAVGSAAGSTGCAAGNGDEGDVVVGGSGGAGGAAPVLGDALPVGAISFFDASACPHGWSPYGATSGRLLVPTVGADPPQILTGDPLADGEDRTHGHALSASTDLGSVSYAGIAGEANHGVAAQQTVPLSTPADATSSGLPYVQLLVCKKTEEPPAGVGPIPSGMLIFWDTPFCPEGFAQPIATQGRILVGVPQGAAAGLSFGGASLGSGETRTHGHDVSGTLTTTAHGIALASGCCAAGYGADGSYDYAGSSDEVSVELPTITLLQCQKS